MAYRPSRKHFDSIKLEINFMTTRNLSFWSHFQIIFQALVFIQFFINKRAASVFIFRLTNSPANFERYWKEIDLSSVSKNYIFDA